MFILQVQSRPVSDEEKFGYLLEMVIPKVRERISNLKPSALGYKTAWERLEKEYGQTTLVVNAHMDEIINLTPVIGNSYDKVSDFYERLSKNFNALQIPGEEDMLRAFVMTTLKKLPQAKPDLVRVDNNWEEWDMKELIDNLQKWLQRNKTDDSSADSGLLRRRERHWYTKGKRENGCEPRAPSCLYWLMARCSPHTTLAQKIDRYQTSFRWRFKESSCEPTWTRPLEETSYRKK